MALSANTVWEVRTAGNDTNGGGFVSGASGNDYSLQDSKNTVGSDISTTDAVANGTTTLTSATANFGTTIVGNIIYLQGGTGSLTAVWRQVTARASTTSITLDATVATGTGITMNIGGALLSPAVAAASITAGNLIFIKNGTYTISSTSTNVANGCISLGSATRVVGYSSTRTFANTDTRPVLQLTVASATLLTGGVTIYKNITFDGNSQSPSTLIGAAATSFIDCKIMGFATATGTAAQHFENCEITTCAAAMTSSQSVSVSCSFHGNTATPCAGNAFNCVSYNNTGASTDGFTLSANTVACNCTAYANDRTGFRFVSSGSAVNCLAESNVGNGFDITTGVVNVAMINCAHFGNAAGVGAGITAAQQIGTVALSSSAMIAPASQNFALNNTASAGASARHAGYPTTLAVGSTAQFLDIGAVEPGGTTVGYFSAGGA